MSLQWYKFKEVVGFSICWKRHLIHNVWFRFCQVPTSTLRWKESTSTFNLFLSCNCFEIEGGSSTFQNHVKQLLKHVLKTSHLLSSCHLYSPIISCWPARASDSDLITSCDTSYCMNLNYLCWVEYAGDLQNEKKSMQPRRWVFVCVWAFAVWVYF